jgi:hypothetical protein
VVIFNSVSYRIALIGCFSRLILDGHSYADTDVHTNCSSLLASLALCLREERRKTTIVGTEFNYHGLMDVIKVLREYFLSDCCLYIYY